ncbi:hypothetical protein IMCC21224_1732 [Puniceibacterium sp. IMCC21224]|nr:hypothetical protein IMCC21224_1732 [Puniceibacterium sp. IMCC21224]
MQTQRISCKRHRFPPQIIAHVVWLYVRFNLSLREVEELMLERGVDVSYEAIRRWTVKFRPPDRPRSTTTAAAPWRCLASRAAQSFTESNLD